MLNEQNVKLEVLKLAAEEKGTPDQTLATAKKYLSFVSGEKTTAKSQESEETQSNESNESNESNNESEEPDEVETKKEPVKRAPRKTKEVAPALDKNGKANVTVDEVLALSRIKMNEGHERAMMKAKINELGADGVSGLSPENRNIFYDFLNDLTIEESL